MSPEPDPPTPSGLGEVPARPAALRRLRSSGAASTGLLVLAVFYTLYLGRAFFLPLVLAVLLGFLLRPAMRFLERLGIPSPLGAALLLGVLLVTAAGATYQLSGPAARWAGELPERLRDVERTIREVRRPVEEMQEATKKVQDLADLNGEEAPQPTVQVRDNGFGDLIFDRALSLGISIVTVTFLLFFLLSSGDLFLRKLVRMLPTFGDRKRAVRIARRIETDVSTYLFTVTGVNLGLGCAVALAMALVGMPSPVLWGVMAGVFNFVPYVGATLGAGILFLAALTTFGTAGAALGVVAVFATLTSLEGYLVTPMILGHRLTLNPVAIFVGVIFWGWLWGVTGAVLAVPVLATVKIFCDNLERLSPLGDLLGP